MNRKDLRTAEAQWRSTPQRKFEVPEYPPKRVKLLTVLKWMAVIILLVLLYDNLDACKTALGNSSFCTD